ncbi:MAG TPA: SRPBCC domain-containing protein [Allosphingosinicella sp.]|jgi:uncharacterized protein YndB with AHSA1/START domain
MARTLRFEALYPYSREQVWIALTDPEAIADWLMPNDFSPVVGHRFTFRTKPGPGFDGIVHCEVLEVEPPRLLAYSWKGGGIETVVRYRLEEEATNTRLFMEHANFAGIRGFFISRILGSGWKRIVADRIPAAAARVSAGRYRRDPDAPLPGCD